VSTIEHGNVEWVTEGERIGQPVQLSYKPRMSGHVVGRDTESDNWLVELDVPYGENSGIYIVIREAMLAYMDMKATHDKAD